MPIPIPEKKAPVSFVGTYSLAEFEEIRKGFKPQGMEGKWRVTFKEPWLYFRRSWTGYYIYGIRFCQKGQEFTAVESWRNADGAQFSSVGSQHDEAMLKFLIEGFLLGKSIPFPMRPDIRAENAALYQWHVLGDERPRSVPFRE